MPGGKFFTLPRYIPASDLKVRAILVAQSGAIWAFVDEWSSWCNVARARVITHGDDIELALRPYDATKPLPPPEAGETPVVSTSIPGLTIPSDWKIGDGLYAVELPFRPRALRFVDHDLP